MKIKVLAVHEYPEKKCFKVFFDSNQINTPKMKTYGFGIITEKFSYKTDLLGKFTSSVGKVVDVSFDIRGNIDNVTA